ncbi:hypothetical protein FLONG3_1289 [Fusarium longipes]|uniref:Uncharacterized protein n=1 Tax=Fusarium longipes TaxID=694270 RepID=A0A395T765_9HYPO|nr:hypothetical protein FLONG3_1289 [Fusarium longipes]
MGLPLFIARVESDLPPRAADKSSATAAPRSLIRRTRIERRAAAHRRILRDRFIDGSLQQPSSQNDRDAQSVPWIEAGFPPDADLATRPLRDLLRDMNALPEPRRERAEERLHSLFRDGTPANRPESLYPSDYEMIRLPRMAAFRNEAARPMPRQANEDDEVPPRRLPPIVLQPSIHRSDEDLRASLRGITNRENDTRPQPAIRRSRYLDGLGDRERSLSPEVWDTLLSTLTPDPQPPSAGSSFASNMASQSAGASSGTSFTTPDLAQDTTIDQACESGCEGSETEEPDMQAALNRRRRDDMRRVRVRLPEPAGLAHPVDSTADRGNGAVGSDSRHRRSPDGPVTDRLRRARSIRDRTNRFGPYRAHGWVGQLSIGNSDDEQGPERTGRSQESPATSGSNTNAGEEDWMSMQHIVRSLARREDIPDEWWAGAGLSRTLPGDGTE